jgi:hypothetical protein
LQRRLFLQCRLVERSIQRARRRAFSQSGVASVRALRRMRARAPVNTSLSRKLFFFTRWCIDEECSSIPECTHRLSHLTSEGNMAKKAKKAKKAVKKVAKTAAKKTAKKTKKVAKKK